MHRFVHMAFGLCVIAAIVASVGAWRLAQGPVDISWLSDRAREALLDDASPVQVRFGHASLTWGGWSDRLDHLLELQVSDITILGQANRTLVQAPRAWMTFSLPALLNGRFIPRTVEIDQAHIVLPGDATVPQQPAETLPDISQVAKEFAAQINGRSAAHPGVLDRLIRVHLRNASFAAPVTGRMPPLRGSAIDVNISRPRNGQVHGVIAGVLSNERQSSDLSASFDLVRNAESRLSVRVSPFRPSALGDVPFVDGVDLPVSLSAHLTVDADFTPRAGQASIGLGAGTIRLGTGNVPLRGGSIELSGTPEAVTLTHGRFELAPDPASSPAVLRVAGSLGRHADRVSGSATIEAENIDLAKLSQLWPTGVSGGARSWIVTHVLGGVATRGSAALALEADGSFNGLVLTQASGTLEGSGVSFTWLDNMPPVDQAEVHLRLNGPDSLDVLVQSARQHTGTDEPDLLVDHGVMQIAGLSHKDQTAAIDLHTDGAVTSALALLKRPRLHLLSEHPLGFKVEAGRASATLGLQFPLDNNLRVDDVAIHATAHLSELRLPHVVGGNTLENGACDLDITKDGLHADGNATLAGIPVKLQGSMDFNPGSANQVVQKLVVTGRPTAAALRTAGVDVTAIADGPIAASVTVQDRRNGNESISIEGDLTETSLSVTPLAWTKRAGVAASLSTALSLQHGRLAAVDGFSVLGSQLTLVGSAKVSDGHVSSVLLDELRLGQTHGRGTVLVPPKGPLGIVLSVDTLDLSGKLTEKGSDVAAPEDVPVTTPRWLLDGRVAQVVLANDVHAANMVIKAQGNGEAVQTLDAVATLDGGTRFTLRMAAAPDQRILHVEADDAGQLLRGLDVVQVMQSGRLVMDATFGSADRYYPLAGSAIIKDTRLTRSPAVGKLLQAITIYGLADVVRGPGMRISNIEVPFEYDGRAIIISNARAHNPSLGFTARGRIGTRAGRIAMEGTVVPAYFFNAILGGLPLVGKLFSPEKGGGVFAVGFSLSGDLNDPAVSVNPVSALTPGFLRNLFSTAP